MRINSTYEQPFNPQENVSFLPFIRWLLEPPACQLSPCLSPRTNPPRNWMVTCSAASGVSQGGKMDTKFNVAAFGIPQYSINPHEMGKMEKFSIKQQIEFYKAYRPLFQYGRFRSQENGDRTIWTISNGDRSAIMVLYYLRRKKMNTTAEKLYVDDANPEYNYTFIARDHWQTLEERSLYPQEMECYTLGGDALKWAGISLSDNVSGNGSEEGMRTLTDHSSRLYIIRKAEDHE